MNKKIVTSKGARLTSIALGFLLPAIAAKLARTSAGRIYRLTTHVDPPRNPASPEVAWKEALVWSAIAGVVGAVARLTTRRWIPLLGLPAEGYDMEDEVKKIED